MASLRPGISLLFFALVASSGVTPARADEGAALGEQAASPAASPPSAPRRDLSMGAELMVLPTQRGARTDVFGVGGAASFALGNGFSLGPSLALLRADLSGETSRTLAIIRPGARLAWHSDDGNGIFGVSLDLGTWAGLGGSRAVTFLPYLQPGVVMQWPKGAMRPYLAVNAMLGFGEPGELMKDASEAFGPFGVGLAIGVSWSAL